MHKIMALDIGTKRIGIALSDFLHVIANRHSFIPRVPESKALETICSVAEENKVQNIVVGIPINMDGTYGFQAEDCKNFANKIEGFNIIFEDERLTSEQAEENLNAQRINFRKEKGLVDMESARLILEQYLSRL